MNNLNDIKKIIHDVKHKSLMIAQTPHTFSGIEVALLDLLAKKESTTIYSLLGYKKISIRKLHMLLFYLEITLKIHLKLQNNKKTKF